MDQEFGATLNGSAVRCTLFDLLSLKDLNSIDYGSLGVPVPTNKSAYSETALRALQQERCQAQPADSILKRHLYLGSAHLARNIDFLQGIGVTDVIVLATLKATTASQSVIDSNINLWKVDIPDCLGVPIIAHFRAALHLITSTIFPIDSQSNISIDHIGNTQLNTISSNNRVLFIHCQQGISRSTALVILYLYYRFFFSLDDNAPYEAIVEPRAILERIQRFRAVAPNPSFLCQLQLIHETLQCIYSNKYYNDITSITERRKAQFNLALKFSETYIETDSRCIAETLAYLTNCVVHNVITESKKTLDLGLRAWTMKNSSIRNYQIWLREALLIEGFSTYSQQLASYHCIVQGVINCLPPDKELDAFQFAITQVNRRWNGEDVGYCRLPLGDITDHSVTSEPIASLRANFVNKTTETTVLNNIPVFTLPNGPIFSESDPIKRQEILKSALGLEELQSIQMEHGRGPVLLEMLVSSCEEASELMHQLLGRYDCRNWALWIIDRLVCLCNRLVPRIHSWISMSQSRRPPTDSALSPSTAVLPPILGRKMEHPAERRTSNGLTEPTKKRRHIRYDDLSLDELRREVDSAREKVEEMRRVVTELKKKKSFF